jgi:K+-transporting ATPase ATPase B chain
VVEITQEPGESFRDAMISLVEGAQRRKTPNEIALGILLGGLADDRCRGRAPSPDASQWV